MMTMQYIMAGGHDSLSLCRVEGNGFKCFQKGGLMGLDRRQAEMCKVQMLPWIHRGRTPSLGNLRALVSVRIGCVCKRPLVSPGPAARSGSRLHWDSVGAPARP